MKKLTILMAAVALVCFSVPAMAVDWNFYGSARMATFWVSDDFGDGENAAKTDSKDQDLQWDFQGNSRLGANVKAENIKGQIELGLKGDSGDIDVGTRRAYGVWNFGAGYLKVGKDYTPVTNFISGQVFAVDLGMLGIGNMYGARPGQVAFGFGNFEIALITPKADLINGMKDATSTLGGSAPSTFAALPGPPYVNPGVKSTRAFKGDPDRILPKIEAKWGMGFDAWNFNLFGGYQYYSIEDVTSFATAGDTDDIDVNSWVVGGDVGFNFGPAFVKGQLSYGSNIGNANWGDPGTQYSGQSGLAVWDGDDDVNDTTTLQALLVGGLKVSDMLSFEAGAGYRENITDGGTERDGKPWGVYVQSVIALAPGVYVVPEVGYFDFDNNAKGEDAGSQFYLGGKWQIDF
jgi:hypothetical protein